MLGPRTAQIAVLGLCLLGVGYAQGQTVTDKPLQLRGQISEDGSRIGLNWGAKKLPQQPKTTVFRRPLGAFGKVTWQPLSNTLGATPRYLDTTARPGTAYEYQVIRDAGATRHVGYWVAGQNVPAEPERGKAVLVIDETIADDLAPHLDRFERDLVGDGWITTRLLSPRGPKRKQAVKTLELARSLRDRISTLYQNDPFLPHTLILIGRVPGVWSGNSAPDGHGRGPLHTDLFYADADGQWPDDGNGRLLPSTIPSDHIEMQIGRIDFSDLRDGFADEVTLLKSYFDRNHAYRHGRFGTPKGAYASNKNLVVEANALRNIFGPKGVSEGGHHDVGQSGPWTFGVHFGAWKKEAYLPPNEIEAVFAINFGSGKHKLGMADNILTATLAQQKYMLAVGWGGRPAWQIQHMALGRSIGYSHLRTVNNGSLYRKGPGSLEYTPTGLYKWINPIWVNLLGDPTLRLFVVPPPEAAEATSAAAGGVRITWRAPEDANVTGYYVYRGESSLGPFVHLNQGKAVTSHELTDPDGAPGSTYMIRTEALQTVHAGSFHAVSQGVFLNVSQ